MNLNKHSKKITQDESLPAAQAMLYGIGLKDNDFKKLVNNLNKTNTTIDVLINNSAVPAGSLTEMTSIKNLKWKNSF